MMSIRHILLAGLLLTLGWNNAHAATERFWIIGSYMMESNAIREKERLEGISDFVIQIVPSRVNGALHYRLATRQATSAKERDQQKSLLVAANIDEPWRLDLDLSNSPMRIAGSPSTMQSSTKASSATTVPADPTSTKPGQSSRAMELVDVPRANRPPMPRTNKEYFEYCVTKATAEERAMYCGNDKLGRRAMYGN